MRRPAAQGHRRVAGATPAAFPRTDIPATRRRGFSRRYIHREFPCDEVYRRHPAGAQPRAPPLEEFVGRMPGAAPATMPVKAGEACFAPIRVALIVDSCGSALG